MASGFVAVKLVCVPKLRSACLNSEKKFNGAIP